MDQGNAYYGVCHITKKEGKAISFSACKEHISFYVGAEVIEEFASELNEFVTKKNAIYFPYHKSIADKIDRNHRKAVSQLI